MQLKLDTPEAIKKMTKAVILLVLCGVALSLATSVPYVRGRISGIERMSEPDIRKCLKEKRCVVTLESMPLCGSDDNTYPNRGSIDCLNQCIKSEGEKVTIAKPGYCEKDIIRDRSA